MFEAYGECEILSEFPFFVRRGRAGRKEAKMISMWV
jgi:hypothetical protein